MSIFLEKIVGLLPVSLQPYAKAVVPLVLAAVLVVQDLTISVGEVDELKTVAGAVVLSLLTFAFPNINE